MFERPVHRHIATVLGALNPVLMDHSGCRFGGGTAIALSLDEYRESVDIDFLCDSSEGYSHIRTSVFNNGFRALFPNTDRIKPIRDIRRDQYSIRTALMIDGHPLKMEIIREDRIEFEASSRHILDVPTLSRMDQFCEKLLANADRYADRSTHSRDIIDLSMMMARWPDIMKPAWRKARKAYRGNMVDRAFSKAVDMIHEPDWLSECMTAMKMNPCLSRTILNVHDRPAYENPDGSFF